MDDSLILKSQNNLEHITKPDLNSIVNTYLKNFLSHNTRMAYTTDFFDFAAFLQIDGHHVDGHHVDGPHQITKDHIIVYRDSIIDNYERVFKYEVSYCDNCGTKLKLISTITSTSACKKILDHLKVDSEEVYPESPRVPPEEFCNFDFIQDDSFNQESNW